MKVKQLLEQLKALDPEQEVLMSIDPEGNGFYKLAEVAQAAFSGEKEYRYDEVGIPKLTEEAKKLGYSEEDVKPVACVCLWP